MILRTPSLVDRFPLNTLVHEMAVWCILTLGEIFSSIKFQNTKKKYFKLSKIPMCQIIKEIVCNVL